MAVKADAPGSLDEVHSDVLAESRQACYKVLSPDRLFSTIYVRSELFLVLIWQFDAFEQGSRCFLCLCGEGIGQKAD